MPENRAAVTIYSKETDSYICISRNGRIKMMRPKHNMLRQCQFFESLEHGVFRYESVVFKNQSLGFQKNGKPIRAVRGGAKAGGGGGAGGRKRPIDEKCYLFQRINPSPLTKHYPLQKQQRHQQQAQQRPGAKKSRSQNQQSRHRYQQQEQQQQQQQQQDSRKDTFGGDSNGNSLLTGSHSATSVSLPHPHRHKHGNGRAGKFHPPFSSSSSSVHQNLDTGATPRLGSGVTSSFYGADSGAVGVHAGGGGGGSQLTYGKSSIHRRTRMNSHTASVEPSIATKLPPKSSLNTSHPGPRSDAGSLKDQHRTDALEATNGGRSSGGNGRKKASTNDSSNASGRNGAVPKFNAPRRRDERALG
uniref:Fibroblast growth factor n=1 Tax=Anopheles farauti TaxID=69004 RepID=A0A182Q5Q6_9DIPT